MNSTKDNWIKAFRKRFVHKGEVGGSFEVAGEPAKDIESFISQVEKDAIEKTKQEIYAADKNWQQSLNMAREKGYLEGKKEWTEKTKRECEDLHKNDPTPEDIRELMESVEKETEEKTNKRWKGKDVNGIVLWKSNGKWYRGFMDYEGEYSDSYVDSYPVEIEVLSDLLEDKV